MKQLDDLLNWKISQVTCDSCKESATSIYVPHDSGFDHNFSLYELACDDFEHKNTYQRTKLPFSLSKRAHDLFMDYMKTKIILTKIGFYPKVTSKKKVNFKNAHAFFKSIYEERKASEQSSNMESETVEKPITFELKPSTISSSQLELF